MSKHTANTKSADLELLALEDVAVGTAALARARRDDGVETAGRELRLEQGVDLGVLLALVDLALCVVRQLFLLLLLSRGLLSRRGGSLGGGGSSSSRSSGEGLGVGENLLDL